MWKCIPHSYRSRLQLMYDQRSKLRKRHAQQLQQSSASSSSSSSSSYSSSSSSSSRWMFQLLVTTAFSETKVVQFLRS
eukprot:g9358.t1